MGWPGGSIATTTWSRGDEATLLEPALAALTGLAEGPPRVSAAGDDSASIRRVDARFEGMRSESWGDVLVFGVRVDLETMRPVQPADAGQGGEPPPGNAVSRGELRLRARDGAFIALHLEDGTLDARWAPCPKAVLVSAAYCVIGNGLFMQLGVPNTVNVLQTYAKK